MAVNVIYEYGIPYVKGEYIGKTYTLTERGREVFLELIDKYGNHPLLSNELVFQSICQTEFFLGKGYIPMIEEVIIEEF